MGQEKGVGIVRFVVIGRHSLRWDKERPMIGVWQVSERVESERDLLIKTISNCHRLVRKVVK